VIIIDNELGIYYGKYYVTTHQKNLWLIRYKEEEKPKHGEISDVRISVKWRNIPIDSKRTIFLYKIEMILIIIYHF
jgi:thiamine biosynthesis lipoprotein ApbE